jgi:hypothetical protein
MLVVSTFLVSILHKKIKKLKIDPNTGKKLVDLYRIKEKYIPLVGLMKESGLLQECATWENWEEFAHRLGFKSGGDLLKTIEGMSPESAMTIRGKLIEGEAYSRVDDFNAYLERALKEAGIEKGSRLYIDIMETVSARLGPKQNKDYSQL